MSPGDRSAVQATAVLDTPLGPMEADATGEGICRLEFAGDDAGRREAAARRTVAGLRGVADSRGAARRHLNVLGTQLGEYFAGRRRDFDLPLVLAGTGFQERVWRELLQIPFGETISYEELASRAGSPGASRAAGQANGRNPIAIVIPCHRVVRASGEPGGYAGGPDRKLRLLDLEAGGVQGTLFSLP